jgi:hypothetical protein
MNKFCSISPLSSVIAYSILNYFRDQEHFSINKVHNMLDEDYIVNTIQPESELFFRRAIL